MKILIAEDDAVAREYLHSILDSWDYEVLCAKDGLEAWQILEEHAIPLVILDWMMPGMDGPELCRRVRASAHSASIYLIMLTCKTEKTDTIEALKAGADDYLSKPFDEEELKARLRSGRRVMELQNSLRIQATSDSLTEIWNRAMILEMAERELHRAKRSHQPVSILMADLDDFKKINDVSGHIAGDCVLREAAKRLRSCLRAYDSIGRYGGEEFLVLLPKCDAVSAKIVAERLRISITESAVRTTSGMITVTASIGIATTAGMSNEKLTSVIHEADQALYRAKERGKNRVESFAPPTIRRDSPGDATNGSSAAFKSFFVRAGR
jgi:diguanylate cyclase (GGDEF)-like protein